MTRARLVPAAVAVAVAVALAGCGVPVSDGAVPVAGARRLTPAPVSPTPTAEPSSATGTATVWYVDKTRLVPRSVTASLPVTASSGLDLLGTAPTGADGLVTLIADPVGGPPLATLPTASPTASSTASGPAMQHVVLSPTFSELTAEEQVLLIGQVVLTLTELDPSPVLFVDAAGAPLSVPLPDGRLRDGAVTRGDYVALT